MASVFKQAATQSRKFLYIQLHHIIVLQVYKVLRLVLEHKFGKSKLESKPFSKITTNLERDIVLMISSNQLYHPLLAFWICILMLRRSKFFRINTECSLEISSSTLNLLLILTNNLETLNSPRQICHFCMRMEVLVMTKASYSSCWTT